MRATPLNSRSKFVGGASSTKKGAAGRPSLPLETDFTTDKKPATTTNKNGAALQTPAKGQAKAPATATVTETPAPKTMNYGSFGSSSKPATIPASEV